MYTTNSINHELIRSMRSYKTILNEINNLEKINNKDININNNINQYKKDLLNLRSHMRYLIYLSRLDGIQFPEDKILTMLKEYNNK